MHRNIVGVVVCSRLTVAENATESLPPAGRSPGEAGYGHRDFVLAPAWAIFYTSAGAA
jgi:hypothetical protein